MPQYFMLLIVCLLGIVSCCGASQGRVGADGRGGWNRRPVAYSGMFGGIFPSDLEPYLLEFHGPEDDQFQQLMAPFMKRLRKMFRKELLRFDVSQSSTFFRYMSILDADTMCMGVPFYYNRRTGKSICGATTWKNLKRWAMGLDCKHEYAPLTCQVPKAIKKFSKKLTKDTLLTMYREEYDYLTPEDDPIYGD